MRCPKCHYLSFEPEPRCRNCGFDFALEDEPADLSIKPILEPEGPFVDFDLRPASAPKGVSQHAPATLGLIHPEPAVSSRVASASTAAAVIEAEAAAPSALRRPESARLPAATTTELPLFIKGLSETQPDHEGPLVNVPASPRPPLSVRRAPTEAPRKKPVEPRAPGPVDRDLLEDLQRIESTARPVAPRRIEIPVVRVARDTRLEPVGAPRRLLAAVVDLLFVGGLNAAVFWFSLRWIGLTFAETPIVALLPFAAFLLLMDIGYLLLFTAASGQTLGKMLAGIRVVDEAADELSGGPVTFHQSIIRAVAVFPSIIFLGAGFVPALIGSRIAVHDRISHTRVVRV